MTTFPYSVAPKHEIPCNLCGGTDTRVLSHKGTEGLPLTTVRCNCCGLIYISPRMPNVWYDRYYNEEYRQKTLAGGKSLEDVVSALFAKAKKHGHALGLLLQEKVPTVGKSWLEVGSSTGGVLSGFRDALGVSVLGIEPSAIESEYARTHGVPTITALAEDVGADDPRVPALDGVICAQALNHLLDPKSFFVWAHERLSGNGLLVLEVMNFAHQLERGGRYENAVQIDHVYMFTPEVLRKYVEAAGFDIVFFEADLDIRRKPLKVKDGAVLPGMHIRVFAKRAARQPFAAALTCTPPSLATKLYFHPLAIYARYLLHYRFA